MLSDKNLPMVGILDLDEHLSRRRAWNRGLGPGALKEYEGRVAQRAQQLIHRLEDQNGEIVLGTWINYFAYVFNLCPCSGFSSHPLHVLGRYDFMCDMAYVFIFLSRAL